MRENKALSAWRRGEQTIGCWLSLANAYSAEAISKLGFDLSMLSGDAGHA